MPESTFTFRVEEDLKAAFAKTAKAQERTAAQLLRALMREAVEREKETRAHHAWFRREVEKALREAGDRRVRRIPHETVQARWRKERAKLAKRARGKKA